MLFVVILVGGSYLAHHEVKLRFSLFELRLDMIFIGFYILPILRVVDRLLVLIVY